MEVGSAGADALVAAADLTAVVAGGVASRLAGILAVGRQTAPVVDFCRMAPAAARLRRRGSCRMASGLRTSSHPPRHVELMDQGLKNKASHTTQGVLINCSTHKHIEDVGKHTGSQDRS